MFSKNNNNKITRHTKKQEGLLKGKKEFRILVADILAKDFKTTVKDAQRTKGRCGESQENDV